MRGLSLRSVGLMAVTAVFIASVHRYITATPRAAIARAADPAASDSSNPIAPSSPAPSRPTEPPARIEHPFVAGFDRFYSDPKADAVRGGLLLLGELNCTACHSPPEQASKLIFAKPAPLLAEVAWRANPRYLQRFLADPHGTKPGTTMPVLSAAQQPSAAAALVHYLVSLATAPHAPTGVDSAAIARGEALFHSVGCVACHAPRRGQDSAAPGSDGNSDSDAAAPLDLRRHSVPLSDKLHEKYSLAGLAQFLLDPLAVRPGGRMPHMKLTPGEATDIASYLCRDTKAPSPLVASLYQGEWNKLPNFAQLQPVSRGGASSFSLGEQRDKSNFALTWEGYLRIDRPGAYTFHLTSDDGSRLWIDGELVVDNDGERAATTKTVRVDLQRGAHPIRAAYFQRGGPAEFQLQLEGPGMARQEIPAALLSASESPAPENEPWIVDPQQQEIGRQLFQSAGCAACHRIHSDRPAPASLLTAPPLEKLNAAAGCLVSTPPSAAPRFHLSQRQADSLRTALAAIKTASLSPPSEKTWIHDRLAALNCYACHQRDGAGGVIVERNAYFTANSPDLGDEGRLPPWLSGVGDKLRPEALTAILERGAAARPYMDARMPQFGPANLAGLAERMIAVDRYPDEVPLAGESQPDAKRAGHQLVGKEGLTCISCHTFNRYKSLGIQALDLTIMAERLRPQWFRRYLLDPIKVRPGTRMPQIFVQGKSTKTDVLGGDAEQQINALWHYLSDGRRARAPLGLGPQAMELIVGGEAVIYRNFIQDVGPRAIAVGYPEEVNLAWDANSLNLAMIWQGRFIDASRHWTGRGEGYQPPLGERVVRFSPGPTLAQLADDQSPWPKPADSSAKFRGYRLDDLRRPTFKYDFDRLRIEDFFTGAGFGGDRHLVRTLRVINDTKADAPADQRKGRVFCRLAAGKIESLAGGAFKIDGQLTLKIQSPTQPLVRNSAGQDELLVPVSLTPDHGPIVVEYFW